MSKIIHISGPSGSGKTTIGNKLKEKFGNQIIIIIKLNITIIY